MTSLSPHGRKRVLQMARSVEKLTRFLCERTAELTYAVHD
jgi:hypothetical protein